MYLSNTRLLVTNFQACYRFYRDVMGFAVTWGEDSAEEAYASFRVGDGGAHLALFKRDILAESLPSLEGVQAGIHSDKIMLVFELEDRARFESAIQAIKAKEVELLSEPRDHPDWGIRTTYLRDPDGNLIELETPLGREEMSDELRSEMDHYTSA